MTIEVPLSKPSITESEIQVISDVFRGGWLAHGQWNHKFEHEFASKIGVSHAIAMNSCTSALEIALLANDIRGEVIVPSMTWVSTANCVLRTGGTPVFCEVDPETRNVTKSTILEKVTSRTEAIIIVHFAGQPCQMDDIVNLCSEKNLLLIEDSAETLGGTWKSKQAGSFGIGCFSFFPTKNITTAEGGMFTCNDSRLAEKARALIAHGILSTTFAREKVERPWLRAAELAGHNYRMPNPLAALGYHQLLRLDAMNNERKKIALFYDENLSVSAPAIQTPLVREGATHVYQMYTVRAPWKHRDNIVRALRKKGIGASVHFDPPVHLQPCYQNIGMREGMLPITERLAKELISVPIYPDMPKELQSVVVSEFSNTLHSLNIN